MNKKLVKCLVCGAIFEEGIESCPVCGVGAENFTACEEENTVYKKDTTEIFLILGNGAAGFHAAQAIRERNATCSIVMVTNEGVLSYNRPMLTKSMLGEKADSSILIKPESWYRENNILTLTERTVMSIDSKAQEVVLDGDVRLHYDKCIYALGSECFVPPIKGYDKPEVIAVRRLSDTEKLGKLLPQIQGAVVIGGGVLGLEAAWELKKAGLFVTVLELAPQLMGRQLDEETGGYLKGLIEEKGLDIRLGVKIEEIEGEGHVTGVRLGDGEVIAAELVIVSAGVRAGTGVAAAAGIEVNRAIVVNERMETNIKNIYACGDCAEFEAVNYAIWPEAVEMGRVAGVCAAGDSGHYETAAAALTFNGMGTSLFSIGDNGKNPEKEYRAETVKNEEKKIFKRYYFADGVLTGAILIGDLSSMGVLMDQISRKAPYAELFPDR